MPYRMNALSYLRGIGSMRGLRMLCAIGPMAHSGGSPSAAMAEKQSLCESSSPPQSGRSQVAHDFGAFGHCAGVNQARWRAG